MTRKRVAYLNGKFLPYEKALLPIGTHALQYGTGCFEGIRAYWNKEQAKLFVFRLADHYDRLARSCRTLSMRLPADTKKLVELTVELLRRNGYRENVYIRPFVYKSDDNIGLFNLHKLADGFGIYCVPLGAIMDAAKGINVIISRWRRMNAAIIPPGAKPTGIYLNTALAKTEAEEKGAQEAILLNLDGSVAEGSAENVFLVKDGRLVTPAADQNILEGITRNTVIELVRRELKLETIQRKVAEEELYSADEVFLTGTGMEIMPVVKISSRVVGDGKVGKVSNCLSQLYKSVVYGRFNKYKEWLTAV